MIPFCKGLISKKSICRFPARRNPVDTRVDSAYTVLVKKRYLIYLLALSILLVSCLGRIMENPTIVIREINIKPRSFTEVNLLLGLEVQNRNRFDLTFKSFEYTVYINNEEIGKGRLEKEILIPSSSLTRVDVPIAAKFKDWRTTLKTVIKDDDLPYEIVGQADIQTIFGSVNYPFSKAGRIKLK